LPVWDDEGNVIAALFYTYYRRSDGGDSATRPLLISFNGGPGSAAVWMHIAYTGPKLLNIDDEGYPVQPYGVVDNPFSVLDVADIVFVNPVNTGYSRIVRAQGEEVDKDADAKRFFGVNVDVEYLAEWLNTFVTRNNRWRSPKYLIGESYGTARVSGLALALQDAQWMYLNGVILVSPTDLGIERGGPFKAANRLPYFAAAAWYHNVLPSALQARDLEDLLPEVEAYAIDELAPALAAGGFIDPDRRQAVAQRVAAYSGLTETAVLRNNLDVPAAFFWKELLRTSSLTIGRLDSRYLGIDRADSGAGPDYNAELTSWLHSFTPAINYYLREVLNFHTDVKYNMFGDVDPWDRRNNHTGESLRQAMAQNPYLKVLIQSGYFDGATNYFDAKYTMWQLDPSGQMRERLNFKAYRSGHMMYLRRDDLEAANDDIREFINWSTPAEGEAARY
jgi:carboxypeptidase C (cathepsin A)